MAEVCTLLMQISGIKGTSKVDGHEDWIPLEHLNTAFYAVADMKNKGSIAVGGPTMAPIQFAKLKDGTDLHFRMGMLNSTVFPKVVFVKIVYNNGTIIVSEKVVAYNFVFTGCEVRINGDGEAVLSYSGECSSVQLEGNEVDAEGKVTKYGPVGYNFSKAQKL